MNKIDLVMWTLNSQEHLPLVLSSILRNVPDKFVNRKIIVDGGSHDFTEDIAECFDWEFHKCRKGIPYQANMALEMVETPIFASFEHDIILCENWYSKIKDTLKPENVAVSQGIRLSLNPTLRVIEKYGLLKKYIRYSSIDNNLYKTKIIKSLGGFNIKYPVSVDRELQDRVRFNNYKWLINKNIISDHLKSSIRKSAIHFHKMKMLNDYHDDFSKVLFYGKGTTIKRFDVYLFDAVTKFLLSFPIGIIIAKKYNCPSVCLGYPFWRLYKLRTAIELSLRK